MRNIWTIARRDFRAYFTSPIAYIVIALFLLIMGIMFFNNLSWFNQQNLQSQQFGMGKGTSITKGIIQPLYGNMNVVLLFLLPFVTMRLFAEEKRNHTIELLLTSPISLAQLVIGKFLSAFLLVVVMLGVTAIYPLILFLTGNPEGGPILTCYLGTLLMASSIISMGVLFSAMTENQIVAGALAFASGLFFWIINWFTHTAGPVWSDVLGYLSLISHYNNFAQGLLTTNDVLYYLSFIGLGLFLTHRVLDSYRWR